MAKAQGIEPQLAVLETAVLPLDYALKFDNKKAPTVSDQGYKIYSVNITYTTTTMHLNGMTLCQICQYVILIFLIFVARSLLVL